MKKLFKKNTPVHSFDEQHFALFYQHNSSKINTIILYLYSINPTSGSNTVTTQFVAVLVEHCNSTGAPQHGYIL